jgi:hypothetical protein
MEDSIELEAIVLDCGCGYNPNVGFGICDRCKATCCRDCLEHIDGMQLCPKCFKAFVLEKR